MLDKKAVSMTYRMLNNNAPDTLSKLRDRWEKDTRAFEDIDWEAALMHPREVAIKSRLRLIQLKILHRCYYDRKRLFLMGRSSSPNCLSCLQTEGTFIHTIWGCPSIQTYWGTIIAELCAVLEATVPMEPSYVLLGIPNDVDLPRHQLLFCNLGLVVAKRDVARHWGAAETPTLAEWRAGMDMYMAAEKITCKARGCPRKFSRIWGCWMQYYGIDQPSLDGER